MPQLSSFVMEVNRLSQNEMKEKYGPYFLTHYIEDEEMDDSWAFQTNSVSTDTVSKMRDLIKSGLKLNDEAHRIQAFPVQKNPKIQNPWHERISVGRARNNDIFIRDSSVSKLHCYFTLKDGTLRIQDAGSRNGTKVNSQELPEDRARELHNGDEIIIGRISFRVLHTEAFCDFIYSQTLSV